MHYHVGTMIEIPRAALLSDEIAEEAEFFSFGTNDLTQMTFGFSRDDAGKFLKDYYDKKIYLNDPFQRFDQEGTGKLVEIAVAKGKSTRPDIKLGVCGEHGGDPTSIDFFHRVGCGNIWMRQRNTKSEFLFVQYLILGEWAKLFFYRFNDKTSAVTCAHIKRVA